jgi:tetratricopeptide (TPR) repeat protein
MGQVYAGFGQPARAVEHLEQALAIAREIKDVRGEALTRNRLGSVLAEVSDLRRALQHHQDALALARNIGDKRTEAETILRVSEVRHRLGDYNGSLEDATRALALLRSVEDRRNEAVALRDMGMAQLALGRAEEARSLSRSPRDSAIDPCPPGWADTLAELARAGRELGQLEGHASESPLRSRFSRTCAGASAAPLCARRTWRDSLGITSSRLTCS